MTIGIMKSQKPWMPALGLHNSGSVDRQACMEEGFRGFCPLMMNYLLLIDSERYSGCLQLVPTDDSTKLKWIVAI